MVIVDPESIKSKEVIHWNGIHLFHAWFSSCSQKVRLFLRLKNISWTSHVINLREQENQSDWYLGINPKGLVPCLIHDGVVHIESNDIMAYLEQVFTDPPLLPPNDDSRNLIQGLQAENSLHMELRTLTFAFLAPKKFKSMEVFQKYKDVNSACPCSSQKRKEIDFYSRYLSEGISKDQIYSAYIAWNKQFEELNKALEDRITVVAERQVYMAGSAISLVDIAWFVNCDRLIKCGYPLSDHPALFAWYSRLVQLESFQKETILPLPLKKKAQRLRIKQTLLRQTMKDVVRQKQKPGKKSREKSKEKSKVVPQVILVSQSKNPNHDI